MRDRIPKDWDHVRLGDLVTIRKGKLVPYGEHGNRDSELYIGIAAFEGILDAYTESRAGVRCRTDDVLMVWDGERSGLCATGLHGVVGSTVARLRSKTGDSSRFLYYQLASSYDFIQAQRTGTGVPHVPKDLDEILRIPLPSDVDEQQRIAEILDGADEVIRQSEHVIAKLREMKKGLLHDLLTRGLDAKGNLRDPEEHPEQFKDSPLGRIPKLWKRRKLGYYVDQRLIELGRGDVISHDDMAETPGEYPVYSSSATGDGRIGSYGNYIFDEELITWSIDGGGRFFYRPEHKFSVTNIAGYLRLWTDQLDYRWLYYLLDLQRQYLTFDYTYKAHPSVIVDRYEIYGVPLREQRRIAAVLDAHDARIRAEEATVDKLCQVKRGLMDDLLTGRVRV